MNRAGSNYLLRYSNITVIHLLLTAAPFRQWVIEVRHDICVEGVGFEISGFCRGVHEAFVLLGCYTAYVVSCLTTFRNSLSVVCSTTTYAAKVLDEQMPQLSFGLLTTVRSRGKLMSDWKETNNVKRCEHFTLLSIVTCVEDKGGISNNETRFEISFNNRKQG